MEDSLMLTRWMMLAALAAPAWTATLDEAAAPGKNYARAEFRLWLADDAATVRAVLVLVPGSNGDGRPMADDPVWQTFAAQQKLAIVACRFNDKPHDQNFIEEYVNVSQGSGQALLDTLSVFAAKSKHPEIATAPLLLWGMSAGGQFDYEFTVWKPERVLAFVVNKGGIYYTALTPKAARDVPGMLFIGGKDLDSRVSTITGLFALNRRGGALWALAEEPGVAHVIGKSRDVSMVFFEDLLSLRLGDDGALKPLSEKSGFRADPRARTYQPIGEGQAPAYSTGWVPTERVARAWQAMATEKSVEK
jgi:hypothetical protein